MGCLHEPFVNNDLHGCLSNESPAYSCSPTQLCYTYVTLDHKTSLKQVYILANNKSFWSKFAIFLMTKITIRSCSIKIFSKFSTVNISKRNFWLVISIAKNFIWITSKVIFLNIWIFFAPSDSRFSNRLISAKYCPILANRTSIESLFIQLSHGCLNIPHRINNQLKA